MVTKNDFNVNDETIDIDIENGTVILHYIMLNKNDVALTDDWDIAEELNIDIEQYRQLQLKYNVTNHPTIGNEASYFHSEQKANDFIKELINIANL